MKQVALRLDDELAAAIDKARGRIPREVWLRAAVEVHVRDSAKAHCTEHDVFDWECVSCGSAELQLRRATQEHPQAMASRIMRSEARQGRPTPKAARKPKATR